MANPTATNPKDRKLQFPKSRKDFEQRIKDLKDLKEELKDLKSQGLYIKRQLPHLKHSSLEYRLKLKNKCTSLKDQIQLKRELTRLMKSKRTKRTKVKLNAVSIIEFDTNGMIVDKVHTFANTIKGNIAANKCFAKMIRTRLSDTHYSKIQADEFVKTHKSWQTDNYKIVIYRNVGK